MLTIKDKDGAVIRENAKPGQFLSRHRGCRILWGDHYRVMKRRTQPDTLIHYCVDHDCSLKGEELHGPHPEERKHLH